MITETTMMNGAERLYGDLARGQRRLVLKSTVQSYQRRGATGQMVQVNQYENGRVAQTPPPAAGPKPAAAQANGDHDAATHQALIGAGFKYHGEHPHILSMQRGQLYQHPQDSHHFVHVMPGGKWSSFHTDGKTTRLRQEGQGRTSLAVHLSGAMRDRGEQAPRMGRDAKGQECICKAMVLPTLRKSDYERHNKTTGAIEHVHTAKLSYHTCPECEANFRHKDLQGGKMPPHQFRGKSCPGGGSVVQAGSGSAAHPHVEQAG